MADHSPTQDQIQNVYQPKDALGAAIKATTVTAAAGAFVSTIQNTLTRQNVGAMGAFTKFGGTTAVFGTPSPREMEYTDMKGHGSQDRY